MDFHVILIQIQKKEILIFLESQVRGISTSACQQLADIIGGDVVTATPVCVVQRLRDINATILRLRTQSPLAFPFALSFEKNGLNLGESVVLQREINPFLIELRKRGLIVTAVHNHWLFDDPRLMYMHWENAGAGPFDFARKSFEAARAAGLFKKISRIIDIRTSVGGEEKLIKGIVFFFSNIGIFGSQLNMPWLDTVTAIIVGLLICKTAWGIIKEASHELSDGFDETKLQLYQGVINKVDGVKGIKEMKVINYGNNEVLDVVILVNSTLDAKQAHHIATHVEIIMMKDHGVYDVHVHVEQK